MSTHTLDARSSQYPPKLLPGSHFLENVRNLFDAIDFFGSMANSLLVAVSVTFLVLLFDSLAAFVFAKFEFPGRKAAVRAADGHLHGARAAPAIPQFVIMAKLGWIGSMTALIVPAAANAFGIFWMRQYMKGAIHDELLDASRLDGCGFLRQYWHVALPVVRPGLAFLGIFTFMGQWNDYAWPLIALTNPDNVTLQVALSQLNGAHGTTDYGMVMTGALLALIPLLIVFAIGARQIIGDLAQGSDPRMTATPCSALRPWEAPEVTSWRRLPMNAVDRRAGSTLPGRRLALPAAARSGRAGRRRLVLGSTCPAPGPCRTPATCRSTPTSGCRGPSSRRTSPAANPTGVLRAGGGHPRRLGRPPDRAPGRRRRERAARARGRAAGRHLQGLPSGAPSSTSPTSVRPGARRHRTADRGQVVRRLAHRGPGPVVARRHHPLGAAVRDRSAASGRRDRTGRPRTASCGSTARCGTRTGRCPRAGTSAASWTGSARSSQDAEFDRAERRGRRGSPTSSARRGCARAVPEVRTWNAETPELYGLDRPAAPRRRHRRRHLAPPGRLPRRRDRRPGPAGQRRAGLHPRRQPARLPPADRAHGVVRRHARRPGACSSASASTRSAPRTTRTTRRCYDLADELGFYVVDEADIESHDHAHEIADDPRYLNAFVDRVVAHGAAGQEPPVGHHLVAGQRVRLRRQPRRGGGLAAPARPDPAAAVRGRGQDRLGGPGRRLRHRLPDVRAAGGDASRTRSPASRPNRSSSASTRTPWATATARWPTTGPPSRPPRVFRAASSGSSGTTASSSV